MIPPATADALNRIALRAQDVMRAYTAGGFAANSDANTPARPPQLAADPLSVAAPANAYFVTQTGGGVRTFTRDGGFTLDAGKLRDGAGNAVLGYPGGDARGTLPVPLALPANDVALGRCTNVRVESDGTVSYTRATIRAPPSAASNASLPGRSRWRAFRPAPSPFASTSAAWRRRRAFRRTSARPPTARSPACRRMRATRGRSISPPVWTSCPKRIARSRRWRRRTRRAAAPTKRRWICLNDRGSLL